MSKKIRVLIVEDSPVVRALLEHILTSDPRFEIAASVETAEEGLRLLNRVKPDVVSLDIRLPGMNGLDATLAIMADRPTPIVVVSASVECDDLNIAMNALKAGALTVVEKPVGVSHAEYEAVADQIRTQLAIMSQVRVVRQAKSRNLNFGGGTGPEIEKAAPAKRIEKRNPEVLGIVASTGGPNAVSQVLNGLGPDFPLPILIVQHITSCFLEGFVSWLTDVTPFEAGVARPGERPVPGRVYLPTATEHLEIRGGELKLTGGPPVAGQLPSGTVLFNSMAQDLGAAGLGVLLTGMGRDGADGLLAMHMAGARTIAESESTAVIYGMPAAAVELGAVDETLALEAIGARVRQLALGGR